MHSIIVSRWSDGQLSAEIIEERKVAGWLERHHHDVKQKTLETEVVGVVSLDFNSLKPTYDTEDLEETFKVALALDALYEGENHLTSLLGVFFLLGLQAGRTSLKK